MTPRTFELKLKHKRHQNFVQYSITQFKSIRFLYTVSNAFRSQYQVLSHLNPIRFLPLSPIHLPQQALHAPHTKLHSPVLPSGQPINNTLQTHLIEIMMPRQGLIDCATGKISILFGGVFFCCGLWGGADAGDGGFELFREGLTE